jgi:hypothetical protein
VTKRSWRAGDSRLHQRRQADKGVEGARDGL